jgi:hypothetical protein
MKMGDRTNVELSIIAVHHEQAKAIWETYDTCAEVTTQDEEISIILFEEVNYGELPFLNKLEEAGIPYDSDWGSGCEYSAGCRSFRIDENGEHDITEVGNNDTINCIGTETLRKIYSDGELSAMDKLVKIQDLVEEREYNDNPPFTLLENRVILEGIKKE